MKCYSIEGNRQWLDGGAMFGNAPKTLWSKWIECDEFNRIPLACRGLLVKAENKTVLFETGIGYFMEPKLAGRFGIEGKNHILLENLKKNGVQDEDVDYVILSHLHFDHAGGLVPIWPGIENPDWLPHFPNAKYVVSKTQFERSIAPHPRDRASYIVGLNTKLQESNRLILIENNQSEFADLKGLVSFFFTDGHTPGLMHSIIHGENEKIFFAADLIPGISWIHLPIVMGYDRFPEQTVNEKKIVLEKAVAENWLLFYTHDIQVVASQIKRNERGRFEAAEMLHELIGFEV
jgi:glyoxylase-like metal-dependent hydrolase (beta-lactamase superfamily II)